MHTVTKTCLIWALGAVSTACSSSGGSDAGSKAAAIGDPPAGAKFCGTLLSLDLVGVVADAAAPRPAVVTAQATICGGEGPMASWQAIGLSAAAPSALVAMTAADGSAVESEAKLFLNPNRDVVVDAGGTEVIVGRAAGASRGDPVALASGVTAVLAVAGKAFQVGDAADTPEANKSLVLQVAAPAAAAAEDPAAVAP